MLDKKNWLIIGIGVIILVLTVVLIRKESVTTTKTTNLGKDFETTEIKEEELIKPIDTVSPTKTLENKETQSTKITPTLIPTSTPTLIPTNTLIPTKKLTATYVPTIIPTETPIKRSETEATGIVLSATSVELYTDELQQITFTVQPDNTTNKTVLWLSSDEKVATVTNNGLIKAKAVGEATVTARTSNNKTTLIKVLVKERSLVPTTTPTPQQIYPNKIDLNYSKLFLKQNETIKISVLYQPSNVTNKNIYWSSSDRNIATVTDDGLITGKNNGIVTITAKTSNNITDTVLVTIGTVIPTVATKPTPTVNPIPLVGSDGLKIDKPAICSVVNKTVATWQCSAENSSTYFGNSSCVTSVTQRRRSVCTSGCGLVSTSIILQGHNSVYTPKYILENTKFKSYGNICGSGVSWTMITKTIKDVLGDGAIDYDLDTDGKKDGVFEGCNEAWVKSAICRGDVVMILLKRIPSGGHWITAVAVLQSGDIVLKDPGFGRTTKEFNYLSSYLKSGEAVIRNCLAVKASSI